MGRVSKELKEVKAEKPYPVQNKDYYILTFKYGDWAYPGYVTSSMRKTNLTPARIIEYLKGGARGKSEIVISTRRYYVYPGERPNPKWGPVCP